jgi:hypothetical protein
MERITFKALEKRADSGFVTFGAPWKKGKIDRNTFFHLTDEGGEEFPVQSRVTAYWPDGTLKWTAHTAKLNGSKEYYLEADNNKVIEEKSGVTIKESHQSIYVDAGTTKATFPMGSNHVIEDVYINNRLTCNHGYLFYTNEERKEEEQIRTRTESSYTSRVDRISVEDKGKLQVTIKVEGYHVHKGVEMIPFILRFTLAYNEPYIRILHTFLYDANPKVDFMKAIGITFDCPIEGELYNRHIKILGDSGIFHESMQLLQSWRPRIPGELYSQQNKGVLLSKEDMEDEAVQVALKDITIWDCYRLYQDSARHYSIKKGTGKENCCFIDCLHGSRGKGLVAVSGETGGMALGNRDFWQKYPSSIWASDITKESFQLTSYLWSYEHEAMDFRHYDTVGHASAYYEGFDEVLSTPYGIANTNKFVLFGFNEGTPSDECLYEYANYVQNPPVLKAAPEYYYRVKAFGEWSLKVTDTPFQKWMEAELDKIFEFYKQEIEQRDWYGLFDYGDFMHTYDRTRHCWKYDMGGYAWQNTELVPTLWLWYAYLRSGREDIFTVAEAMTRHCSEVDIYHMGEYKGLGSRHNVLHWGCSCKEPRIAMAGHHRFYYYLTGDFRLGDVFDVVRDGDYSTIHMDPLRHFYEKETMVYPTHARSGPDWSSYCSNWLTEWERKENIEYRNKLFLGIEDMKQAPYGLISGSNYEYDPNTGHLRYIGENASGGSHLAICMGGPQIWFELAHLLEDEKWLEMLAEYGVFYFLPKDEKKIKAPLIGNGGFSFPYMAAAMGAYGARYYKNEALAKQVIETLREEINRNTNGKGVQTELVSYVNKEDLQEIPWISTNVAAQWCLNSIVCLELIKEFLPNE